MALLTNKDINSGVIIYERGNYPKGKLILEEGVSVVQGDLIQIVGRYTSEGVTNVIEDTNGSTNSGTPTVFTSAGHNFTSEGVAVNDVLWIKEGVNRAHYTITSVGTTTVTCSAASFSTVSNQDYEIWIETIFKGRVTDKNFQKVKTVMVEDECESDINKPIEADFYCGRMGGLIQELLDNECAFINHNFSQSSPYNYRAPHNFRNEPNGTFDGGYFTLSGGSGGGTLEIIASLGDHKKVCELQANGAGRYASLGKSDATMKRRYDDIEFYIRFGQTNKDWYIIIDDRDGTGNYVDGSQTVFSGIYLKWNASGNLQYRWGHQVTEGYTTIESYSANTSYKIRIKYDINNEEEQGDLTHGWHLWINDVSKDGGGGYEFYGVYGGMDDMQGKYMKKFNLFHTLSGNGGYAYIDAFGSTFDNDYILGVNATKEYDELIYTSGFFRYPMTEKTNRQYFSAYALKYQKIWYLDPNYLVHFDDGDTDSLLNIGATTNVTNVDGKKQVKAIDKVVVKCGIVDGIRIISTYGSGNVLAKDTHAHILNQVDCDAMALAIYNQQSAGILKVALDYEEPEYGLIQVGEEMTIIGNTIRFKKSDDYICTTNTQFKLRGERLHLGPYGKILYNELYLDDVLVFQLESEDETQKATEENSQLISEVGGTAGAPTGGIGGGGEINIGGNVGTGEGEVYKDKSGVTLYFKTLKQGTGITITDNAEDVTLDINLENPPVEDEANKAPTSEWAFDHKANNIANIKHLTDAQISALHARQHLIESVDDHSAVGLTTGHALRATGATTFAFGEIVSNLEYDGVAWNNVVDIAPSKNAVRDVIDPLTSSLKYSGVWTPGTDMYPENQEDDTQGSTVGTSIFTSAGHDFTAEGVKVGDILNIREGVDLGFYVIDVVGTTTVTCTGDTFGTTSDLEYQIFRAIGGEYWICTADGEYDSVWYEVGDWLIWNDTEIQWDRIRNSFGDNIISVSPGDSIQNAIDEVELIGGGTVFLKPGTHIVTTSLTMDTTGTNIKVKGAGDISVIDYNGSTQVFHITDCLTAIFQDFKIDADGVSAGAELLYVNETDNHVVIFNNITIDGNSTNKYGVGIVSNTNNITVLKCNLSNLALGINIDGTALISINRIWDCQSAIYVFEPDNLITGNHIINCDEGIVLDNVGTGAHRSTVTGNIINSAQTANFYNGIMINNCDYCSIVGNTIVNNTANRTETRGGIYVNNGDYNIISGNNVSTNTNSGTGDMYGIYIAGGTGNIIGPNILQGNDYTIYDGGTGTKKIGDSSGGRMALEMYHGGTDCSRNTSYIYMESSGGWISCHFRITANMDATKDIKIVMSLYKETAGTNPTWDRYLGASKTDDSEAFSWNILSASGFDIYLDGVIGTRTITISAVNIDQDDIIVFYLNKTNTYNARVYDISIEFTEVLL